MQHEPLAYIIGEKEFFGLTFKTDKRALIPRWESEILVESAIAWLKNQDSPQIVVEVGTGSGAIILAVAKLYPQHSFIASDISPEALDLARENTHSLGLENITFLPGNLGEPLIEAGYHHKVNLLLANLPYIPSSLLTTLDPTVHYFEPTLALDGGLEGLDLYTQFLPYVCKLLAPEGLLLFEHDYDQGKALSQLTQSHFPAAILTTLQDNLGHDRVLACENRIPTLSV